MTDSPYVRAIFRERVPDERALSELAEPLQSHCRRNQGIAVVSNDATGVEMTIIVPEGICQMITVEAVNPDDGQLRSRKVLGAELDQVAQLIGHGLTLKQGICEED